MLITYRRLLQAPRAAGRVSYSDLRKAISAARSASARTRRVELGGGRSGQEAHEVVGEVELRLVDLGVGDGIDAGRNRLAADALFRRLRRVRDAHLDDKRAGVELREGGDERLAA